MAAWEKPSAELVARFDAWLPPAPGVDRRKMFGCPCAFVNGNMFAGVHEQNLILRLAESARAQLVASGTAGPFTVMGRTMREYVAVSGTLAKPDGEVTDLIEQAFAFASSLPAKQSKRKAAAPAAGKGRRARAN